MRTSELDTLTSALGEIFKTQPATPHVKRRYYLDN